MAFEKNCKFLVTHKHFCTQHPRRPRISGLENRWITGKQNVWFNNINWWFSTLVQLINKPVQGKSVRNSREKHKNVHGEAFPGSRLKSTDINSILY